MRESNGLTNNRLCMVAWSGMMLQKLGSPTLVVTGTLQGAVTVPLVCLAQPLSSYAVDC